MNDPVDLPERFRRLLTGEASEAERMALERSILEDDELFEQLSVLENELVDAFVHRELDAETSRQIGQRIEASPRLQAMAETTMALETWYGEGRASRGSASERAKKGPPVRWTRWRRQLIAGAVLATLTAAAAMAALQAHSLNRSVRTMERKLVELQRETRALEETVAGLQDLNRTLTLRLARLEATAVER